MNAVAGANFGTQTNTGLATLSGGFYSTASSTLSGSFFSTLNNYLASTTLSGSSLFTDATSTSFAITGIATGNILKTTTGGALIAAVSGTDYVTGAGLTSAFPFASDLNFGALANSTTTPVWFKSTLQASSTSQFDAANFWKGASVGSTSPFAYFSIHAASSTATTTLFAIASTSNSGAQSTHFSVNNTGLTTLLNLSATSATTSALSVTASSTIGGVLNVGGQLNANLSAIIASTTLSGSSLLTNATTTSFSITGISSGNILKTTTDGSIVAAVAGTDYTTFSYLFPSNATTTQIAFNGGATFAGATTTSLSVSASSTVAGVLNVGGNAYLNSSVGIGSTTPWAQLSVNTTQTMGSAPAFAIGSTTVGTYFVVSNAGLTGIGTSTPFARLSVTNTVSAPQTVIAYDDTSYVQLRVDSTGDLLEMTSGGDHYLSNDNFWVCTGGSISTNGCPSGAPSGAGNLVVENKLGIGTSTLGVSNANYKLAIETQDTTTAFLNIASSTSNWSSTTNLFTIGANGRVGIGTSTPFARLAIGANGAITTTENRLSTSTSMTVSWIEGNQQLVQTGTSAVTIGFSNYIAGQILRLVVCNSETAAGAITFTGVEWASATAPTQTTTANYCDLYTFVATQASSTTNGVKIFGAAATGFN